ncbi:MAG: TetR/AcrR family transcriptional regulator [Frankia sp.]|nr:TetR/AcrR family transcriptional regulator [Frankia sp.]
MSRHAATRPLTGRTSAPRPTSHADRDPAERPADTRSRILGAAVSLFGRHGYAGTSVRDITGCLGLTKAALYYHFPSKETILDALLDPFVTELTRLVTFVRRTPPPRAQEILERMTDLLAGPGSVLCAFVNDPSVVHRKIGEEDLISLFEEVVRALAGPEPTPTDLLRARCALGAVQSGILGSAFSRLRAASGGPAGAGPALDALAGGAAAAGYGVNLPGTWPPRPIIGEDVRCVVVDAALAALGRPVTPGGPGTRERTGREARPAVARGQTTARGTAGRPGLE